MHLLESGVPLPYIRDLLGHAELSTTEIYARASTGIVIDDLPEWNHDPALLAWLASL